MDFIPRLRHGLIAILIVSPWAQAGELLPYNPSVQQVAKVARAPLVNEQIYTDFAQKARDLDATNRSALLELFEKQLAAASQARDAPRVAHYSRLLTILRGTRGAAQ